MGQRLVEIRRFVHLAWLKGYKLETRCRLCLRGNWQVQYENIWQPNVGLLLAKYSTRTYRINLPYRLNSRNHQR